MQDVLGRYDFDNIMSRLSGKTQRLSEQEKKYAAAIYHYTDQGYQDVNYYLRAENVFNDKTERTIDYIDSALEWLGNYDNKNPVVRYTNLTTSNIDKIKTPSARLYIESYTSTSANQGFQYHTPRDFKLIIYRNSGSLISNYSVYPSEEEVLIPRSSLFEVLKFDECLKTIYLLQVDVKDLHLVINTIDEASNEI